MAGNLQGKYGANNQAITCGMASTVNQHGRISSAIDNTSTVFLDALLQCKVKTGSGAPANNKQVVVYGLGSADGGTTYTDGYTIGDADSAVLVNTARPILVIPAGVASTQYYGGPQPVTVAFGGILPDHWGLFAFNDEGQTMDTTAGNFSFFYQGVYAQYT